MGLADLALSRPGPHFGSPRAAAASLESHTRPLCPIIRHQISEAGPCPFVPSVLEGTLCRSLRPHVSFEVSRRGHSYTLHSSKQARAEQKQTSSRKHNESLSSKIPLWSVPRRKKNNKPHSLNISRGHYDEFREVLLLFWLLFALLEVLGFCRHRIGTLHVHIAVADRAPEPPEIVQNTAVLMYCGVLE